MSVFGNYSSYYDLLYKDKDYKGEVNYVSGLIRELNPSAKSILTLGCGTGKHELLFAEKDFLVEGVDLSEKMIRLAEENRRQAGLQSGKLTFHLGDIRTIDLNEKFDAVVSLFHVACYQTENKDLRSFFQTAKKHLNKGGIFIFDVWHGPAVLTDRPRARTKNVEDDRIAVLRTTEPVMRSELNVVEVNYNIKIRDKILNTTEEINECHRMRYLFKPELLLLLEEAGFELLKSEQWMTAAPPSFDTWYVNYVARLR
jgi:SAM-dependent methyltransferase